MDLGTCYRVVGLEGVVRGKVIRTTISSKAMPCPLDLANRQFHAGRPNALWVSDFTYEATWQGWVYVALVIDALSRRIAGWKESSSAQTDFVLDALEQALYARRCGGELAHHSDSGVQYVSIRYTERRAEAGIETSSAALVILTTTPWLKRSTVCTRPRSSTAILEEPRSGRTRHADLG